MKRHFSHFQGHGTFAKFHRRLRSSHGASKATPGGNARGAERRGGGKGEQCPRACGGDRQEIGESRATRRGGVRRGVDEADGRDRRAAEEEERGRARVSEQYAGVQLSATEITCLRGLQRVSRHSRQRPPSGRSLRREVASGFHQDPREAGGASENRGGETQREKGVAVGQTQGPR